LAPPSDGIKGTDESAVIFVIDISGSMCVSYEVAGKIALKGSEKLAKMTQEIDAFTGKDFNSIDKEL
jgi:hypothetical protein